MRIQKLSLQNFRSIPSLTLKDLQILNCFIGPHNSGKTNILNGISVFWDPFLRAKVQQKHLKSSLGRQNKQDFDRNILSFLGNSNVVQGIFEFTLDESISSWRENNYLRDIFANSAHSFKHDRPSNFFNEFLDDLETLIDPSTISTLIFELVLSQEMFSFIKQRFYLQLKNDERISFQSSNLPIIQHAIGSAFIRRFHETSSEYDFLHNDLIRIIKDKNYTAITLIEGFLKDIIGQEFVFELGEYHNHGQEINVTIEQAFTSPLWRMSTSTIRIIALAYFLTASPLNQIIIIDDPGLHLHPKGERKLARKLQELTKHQFFFSTHSTRLLIGHAFLVELVKGWTKIRQIRGEKSMKKVVKLLGIRPSDSFAADIVCFVEGRTDARVFQAFEKILLGSQSQIPRNRVSYIGVGGWTNMKFVLSIELLKSKFVRSRALAITDGDIVGSETYFKIRKNWASVFPESTFFSLKEESIESLFLNNPVVFLRANPDKQNESLSINELQEFITGKWNRGISDKHIVREIFNKFFRGRYYRSSEAELLARKFMKHEIPEYLVTFYNEFILQKF